MQRLLIVEDEKSQLLMLQETIQNQYPDWSLECANTYENALLLLQQSITQQNPYTLFLLDIQLSPSLADRGGFLFAEAIRKERIYYRTPILFLTAVPDEHFIALSHFHCYNYIAKPYHPEDILVQLNQMLLTGYLQENILLVTDTNRIRHRIRKEHILFAEASSHTIILHTTKGKIATREFTLDALLNELGEMFIRCHRKYIIQKEQIRNYDKVTHYIHIQKEVIPIGKTYMDILDQYLS